MVRKIQNKVTQKEAVQWTGKNLDEIYQFCGAENIGPIERRPDYDLKIKTLEGYLAAKQHDWIVKGLNGEFYPVKPDIFEKSYEFID